MRRSPLPTAHSLRGICCHRRLLSAGLVHTAYGPGTRDCVLTRAPHGRGQGRVSTISSSAHSSASSPWLQPPALRTPPTVTLPNLQLSPAQHVPFHPPSTAQDPANEELGLSGKKKLVPKGQRIKRLKSAFYFKSISWTAPLELTSQRLTADPGSSGPSSAPCAHHSSREKTQFLSPLPLTWHLCGILYYTVLPLPTLPSSLDSRGAAALVPTTTGLLLSMHVPWFPHLENTAHFEARGLVVLPGTLWVPPRIPTAPPTFRSFTSPEAAPKPSAKSIYEQRKRYSTVVMADVSQYQVNHLVTFCLGEEDGVHTVEDASRKLAVMDSQGRIWTQEMLLRVSPGHVTLLDPASKEELESYPLGSIVRCDAVTPPGGSRSLLLLVCQEPERPQPDVHFFQGLRLGDILNHVFEDVETFVSRLQKSAEATRVLEHRERGRRTRRRAAGGRNSPKSRPHSRVAPKDPYPLRHRPGLTSNGCPPGVSLGARHSGGVIGHPVSPPLCLPLTEGLLTLRAKPPSEAEYKDVLQKIKYAFSLLVRSAPLGLSGVKGGDPHLPALTRQHPFQARLRDNIANPSSPELLHFLFGPLQMIVNTSGGPEFASGVERPHLTAEAVALLRDNVTPGENTLWTSLGDSWTRPGLELPLEEGPSYSPKFYSGWEPLATDPQGRTWEDPVERQLQHERRRQQQSAPQVAVNGHGEPELEEEPTGKWVLCNYDFHARNSSELSVKQRAVLEVLDDRRKWWKVRDQQGQEGYVPYNILTPHPGLGAVHSLENSAPPHNPPAAVRAPTPAPARNSCDSLNNLDPSEKEKFSQMLSVNEELQARLAQGRSVPSRLAPGPRAPEPQLSRNAEAAEVRAWLQAKGFSAETVDALGVLTSAQLFSLQKEELRANKEKVSELEAVMEKQKKKVEGELKAEVI
ncbi:Epidermal growth factor receptor kinase substrate 8-like protein 1 [Fukomys damarensis]|uniref:Epidermal growth factor receptor kinase substrate 8-like protein 1 n=1 Tax=Fukomys damarensis TaxID=885580 RepID=A0A091E1A8_FUKDA|nr:Epidermal growth factor receptor kinase substrate 8-like protein 1 [Fukomys damarensis]